jgi:hypothetical protein
MLDPTPAEQELKWDSIAEQVGVGLARAFQAQGIDKDIINVLLRRDGAVQELVFDLLTVLAGKIGQGLHAIEEPFLPVIAAMVAPILAGLFGAEIGEDFVRRKMGRGDGTRGAQAIVNGFMAAIVGDTPGEIQPSDAGARRVAAAAVQASLESTFNALVPEVLSDLIPLEGVGHFTALTELPEGILRTLGVSRLVRRAIQPIVTVCCTTPATWHMNKLHRPTLLGASTLAKQIARHPESREKWLEDLRREGYAEDRIEALINEQARFRSVADLFRLVRASEWSEGDALRHLRDQGYDDAGARDELLLEKLRAIETFDRSLASTAIDGFVSGRITESDLAGFCSGVTISEQEKAQYIELAHARRLCGQKALSSAEAERCVRAEVLSVRDYRDALRREGRTEEAVTALELLLRYELDKAHTAAEHRADMERERAAEKQARVDAATARAAEVAAARERERRGTRADLERAAVLGLVPLSRVGELYAATFDADTAATLLDLLEGRRQDYLAEQAKREDAERRGRVRGVDVGALEAAALAGVLTLDELRGELARLGFPPADVALLADTVAAKIADRQAAEDQRAQAAAAAKVKKISLGTIETLVRRGHRSMAEYDRVLADLGFDDAARAMMRELLQVQIDDDARARAEREAADAKLRARGISLEQFRRGVLLGLRTVDEFMSFLVGEKFTPAAVQLLVDELRADLAEADAARQRRIAAEAAKDTREAPLADVARAVRLGRLSLDIYRARLKRSGYSADDVELEVDLLVTELAEAKAARDKREQADAAARDKGLNLSDTERAVRAGLLPIDAYTAAVRTAGFAADAAAVLTRLLADEIAEAAAERARRAAIEAAGDERRVPLPAVAAAVKAGLRSIEDYYAAVRALGYPDEDAALLTELLERELAIVHDAEKRDEEIANEQPEQHAGLTAKAQAVKDGIISMADYIGELRARGFGAGPFITIDQDGRAVLDEESDRPHDDTELLALLLQVQLDAAAAKGAK